MESFLSCSEIFGGSTRNYFRILPSTISVGQFGEKFAEVSDSFLGSEERLLPADFPAVDNRNSPPITREMAFISFCELYCTLIAYREGYKDFFFIHFSHLSMSR